MSITLKDFMECINYRVTEGSDYLWNSFGPNAYQLDSWQGATHGNTVNVVFDKNTQVVYEMQAWDYTRRATYRWINPDYIDAVKAEYKQRNISFEESVDDERFIDIESVTDMLQKSKAIAEGKEYDTRIIVDLDFTDDELFNMMKIAHEMDMSLNKFVEYILEDAIKRAKNVATAPDLSKPAKSLSMTKNAIRKREARLAASRAFGGGY